MPVSDLYVVQYLLQETAQPNGGIQWEERSHERAGFATRVGGVHLDLENAHFRAGTCVTLRFHCSGDGSSICEPMSQGWLGQCYQSDDDRTLAALMRELMRSAAQQCGKRRSSAIEHAAEIRQRVYRKLLFRDPETGMAPAGTAVDLQVHSTSERAEPISSLASVASCTTLCRSGAPRRCGQAVAPPR